MDWLGTLRTWLVGPDLNAIAEQIAVERRGAVWQRVHHRVAHLALAEARGYVRIKAAKIVREAVARRLEDDRTIRAGTTAYLNQLTMEAVLRLAVLDLIHARQLADRETETPLRIAA